MSKKRPGVPAAVNLMRALEQERSTNCSNDALWNHVNAQETTLIQDIPHLEKHQQALDLLRDKLTTEKEPELSVADLETVLNWKHTVGKNRPFNVKLVRSNNTPTVQHHSRIALKSAKSLISDVEDETSSWEAPLKELVKLKGVGPATASAILCLVRPDVYGYMYDEAIDCVEKTRSYTVPVYNRVNQRCHQIATTNGKQVAEVSKILWIAARYMALYQKDLTKDVTEDPTAGDGKNDRGKNDRGSHDKNHASSSNITEVQKRVRSSTEKSPEEPRNRKRQSRSRQTT